MYGLGGAWVWWLVVTRGLARPLLGIALSVLTLLLVGVVRRRARRLHSPWESIPSRAVVHCGASISSWRRPPRPRHALDIDDFEATPGGRL
ncbi:MAG: hypothetical protein QY307_03305 [Acidimicrobiia bacterium]|nr:MAG: hypothetical protein QY307_03305 [Acidimicrobiia bacterium]